MIRVNLARPKEVIVPQRIRYPQTITQFGMKDHGGDWDRNPDGTIHIYLACLGYADNPDQADCGIPRIKLRCEKCHGKTDYHGHKVWCWFGTEIKETALYKCRKCGHITPVPVTGIAYLVERGFWDK